MGRVYKGLEDSETLCGWQYFGKGIEKSNWELEVICCVICLVTLHFFLPIKSIVKTGFSFSILWSRFVLEGMWQKMNHVSRFVQEEARHGLWKDGYMTIVTNRVLGEAFANISGKTKTKRESGK